MVELVDSSVWLIMYTPLHIQEEWIIFSFFFVINVIVLLAWESKKFSFKFLVKQSLLIKL